MKNEFYEMLVEAMKLAQEYEEQHDYSRDAAMYRAASDTTSFFAETGHKPMLDSAIAAALEVAREW